MPKGYPSPPDAKWALQWAKELIGFIETQFRHLWNHCKIVQQPKRGKRVEGVVRPTSLSASSRRQVSLIQPKMKAIKIASRHATKPQQKQKQSTRSPSSETSLYKFETRLVGPQLDARNVSKTFAGCEKHKFKFICSSIDKVYKKSQGDWEWSVNGKFMISFNN